MPRTASCNPPGASLKIFQGLISIKNHRSVHDGLSCKDHRSVHFPSFKEIRNTLKDIGELASTAKAELKRSVEETMGGEQNWRSYLDGAKATQEEILQLMDTYGIEIEGIEIDI